MPLNKAFDGLTGTSMKTRDFFIVWFHFTHTDGGRILRVSDRKFGVGVGGSLTPLWRFYTHDCMLYIFLR